MSQLLEYLQGVGFNPVPTTPPESPPFRAADASAPLSLAAPNAMLDSKQQFRIAQAMRDMNRMKAAQGKTAYQAAMQKNNSAYQSAAGGINAGLGMQDLMQKLQFGNQMQSFQLQQREEAEQPLMQLLSPLLQALQGYA